MFGDLSNMMDKLKEAQQNIEATKQRLHTIIIDEQTNNGAVKVSVTANNEIKSITISEELTDKEEIEDYLVIALNKALSKANEIKETELSAAAKNGMPNIPGMNDFI
ncbi:MAG: YbaB/EbfC family nucleoid-associated protein [Lutibacter sp.]|uniref:YbaB/EbfC family nucleoid-associated protein n=1 Tax=Lutibacter sp. TaxID=1925666 RepID=UPI00299D2C4C|nr:YbaB/EbfC family nucleoid-associated protein [Lutibacter sp.]MDX1827923.1 YbaB/EbfC family nucleoid-associated protein [Lutibacter sp.]